MTEPTAGRYGTVARSLHWLTALLVFLAIPGGLMLMRLKPGPLQDMAFDGHRSLGFVILCLAVVRILWRLIRPAPPLPASMPGWQQFIAHVTHWLLYGLLIAQPVIGWLATNAYGAAISVFRLFELPVLVGKDEALAKILFGAHTAVGFALAGLVALHVAAALHHGLILKDGVLQRMWGR